MYNMYINYIFSFFDTDNDILFPLLFVVFGFFSFHYKCDITLFIGILLFCFKFNCEYIYIKTCMYDF